jgi:flagellar P-ring protein precursor FlgI
MARAEGYTTVNRDVQGVRANQLVGYGLVVGLGGTGDRNLPSTPAALANMLERFNVRVPPSAIKAKNVASVIVTAELRPFARAGSRIDALVSSAGDAKSLQGGVLLMTPLRAADGKTYAVAQGPLSIGGFAAGAGGAGGSSVQKNHLAVARIPGGALVEREVPSSLPGKDRVTLVLRRADFTTAKRLTDAISARFPDAAKAVDAGTVEVAVPEPNRGGKLVGTVVAGASVKLSPAAVVHGNLFIRTRKRHVVSQPAPLQAGGTVVASESETDAQEDSGRVAVIQESPSVGELADALNALGVTPRDIIAIFQLLKQAGALHAELVVM